MRAMKELGVQIIYADFSRVLIATDRKVIYFVLTNGKIVVIVKSMFVTVN
jgi:hypothetical protein